MGTADVFKVADRRMAEEVVGVVIVRNFLQRRLFRERRNNVRCTTSKVIQIRFR